MFPHPIKLIKKGKDIYNNYDTITIGSYVFDINGEKKTFEIILYTYDNTLEYYDSPIFNEDFAYPANSNNIDNSRKNKIRESACYAVSQYCIDNNIEIDDGKDHEFIYYKPKPVRKTKKDAV